MAANAALPATAATASSMGSGGPFDGAKGTIEWPDSALGSASSAIGTSGVGGAIGEVGKIVGGPIGDAITGGASAAGATELLGGVSIGTVSEPLGSGVIAVTGSVTGVCGSPAVTGTVGRSATLGGAASGDSVELSDEPSLRFVAGGGVAGVSAAGAGGVSIGAGAGSATAAGAGSGVGSVTPGSEVVLPPPPLPLSAGAGGDGSAGGGVVSAAGGVVSVVGAGVVSVAAGAAGVSVVVTSAVGSAVVPSARALEQKANTSDATRMAKPKRRKRLVGP